jgi:hypothetical protein
VDLASEGGDSHFQVIQIQPYDKTIKRTFKSEDIAPPQWKVLKNMLQSDAFLTEWEHEGVGLFRAVLILRDVVVNIG